MFFNSFHFIGLGGIGMCSLAKICLSLHKKVQGSNDKPIGLSLEKELKEKGATIFLGHTHGRLNNIDCVVASSAISNENPELQEAREKGIPILHRSDLLRILFQNHRILAVSGSHGKTTTTALLGYVLDCGGYDPCIVTGGMMSAYQSTVRLSTNNSREGWAVIEADESDRSHLNFDQLFGIIATNIEAEHMSCYGSVESLTESFEHFMDKASGIRVVCSEDPKLFRLSQTKSNVLCYGIDETKNSFASAKNIRHEKGKMSFEIYIHNQKIGTFTLNLMGRHNVLNALGVFCMAYQIGIPVSAIQSAFETFPGVKRRLTVTGQIADMVFFDDYAHHPTEIKAVLESLRNSQVQSIVAICQPHRYTRLRDCFDEFVTSFECADHVILLPVYSAGEPALPNTDSHALFQALQQLKSNVRLCEESSAEAVRQAFMELPLAQNTAVVCMGAGNVTDFAYALPQLLEAI
jgi:UDP-N-acetylmuramate--alanine ligase